MKGYLLAAAALIVVIILGGIGIFFLVDDPQQDSAAFATRATIPYQAIYEIATFGKTEVTDPNVIFCIKVQSSLPEVLPSDISMYIDSSSGSIPLRIGNDGIFELPLNSSLKEENPIVITNQPKGTMSLDGCLRFKGDSENQLLKISYSAIMMPATWAQKKQYDQAKASGQPNSNIVSGLNIKILGPGNMPVVIHQNNEEISLQPDSKGICFIPYRETLLLKNPMITIPGTDIETMGVVMEKAGS